MSQYLNKIANDLTKDKIEFYWQGFKSYAIYDKTYVYLFNHPKFKSDGDKLYQILKWNNQFTGGTLILYKNYPTAIVDSELFNNYQSLYSILVHELYWIHKTRNEMRRC